MRLFRVFPWQRRAHAGQPGHPLYVHHSGQTAGRIDNRRSYAVLYAAEEPAGAAAEAFGDLALWSEDMLTFPLLPDSVRAIATLEAHRPELFELDDCTNLLALGLAPTDVVRRNRDRSQEVALRVWLERRPHGMRWWSYHRPEWRVVGLFADPPPRPSFPVKIDVVAVDELTLDHPAVEVAASRLRRIVSR